MSNRLKPTAIPSVFPWTKVTAEEAEAIDSRTSRVHSRSERKRKWEEACREDLEMQMKEDVSVQEEEVYSAPTENGNLPKEEKFENKFADRGTQTAPTPLYSIDKFRSDDAAIHFYTGLETYAKFVNVLHSLGPAAYCLRYIYFQVSGVSVEDQLFMTLMKLRRYTLNFELSRFFSVSEATVKNIVYTWILFMSKQWRRLNIWPSQELVRHFAPSDFKLKFPTTRVIVDGTECPIKKPKAPRAQQSTFSTYKNRNTVKVLIGSTPGGLVSYVSQVYGGSTSDRQIVERCQLVNACDPGDSVMADKGFNVQDLFAPRNVMVNIPTFFKKKNRMSGKVVLKDRRVSSKRVHVERIIGLGKTFKILTNPLTGTEAKISSDIIFVCYMLCNFRTCIVSNNA